MPYTFEQVEGILNHIQEKQPEIKEIVAFYKEVLKSQLKIKGNLDLSSINLTGKKAREKFKNGFPLFELNLIPDSHQASALLREELSGLVKNRNPAVALEMEKIEQHMLKDDHIFLSLSQNYLLHNWSPLIDFSQIHNLDQDLLFFFIKNSVKPFVESMAEKVLTACDLSSWSEPFCPICGASPALAFLKPAKSKEENRFLTYQGKKRFLVCSLCNNHWQYPRLKCPFCQTEKQKDLSYFYVDNRQRQHRVDVCKDCRGYIKTIDYEYASIPEDLLFLEDLNTMYLDILAEREGYQRKGEGIFSI
jgi:formate dehydrogenase accessory protein FdhE